jgi:hypothetical protein
MSLEFLSAVASAGTFVVITATAIAAVLQLRQQRAGNKIAYIQSFYSGYEGSELRPAFDFVRYELAERLKDARFRDDLRPGGITVRSLHPEITVLNFFDLWGLYYRDGVVDRDSFMRVFGGVVVGFWKRLEPVIALGCDEHGNTSCQDFEYLAVEASKWIARHPNGDYMHGASRMPLPSVEDLFGPGEGGP